MRCVPSFIVQVYTTILLYILLITVNYQTFAVSFLYDPLL